MANNYKSLNQQNWEEGGLGYAGEMAQVRAEQEKIANDPIKGQAFTPEELKQLYGSAGITDNGTYSQKAQVMPWDDAAAAGITLKPTADPNYGYVDGTPRQAKVGDSEADETFLSDADYQLIQDFKSKWHSYNDLANQETDPVKKQEYLTLRDQQNEAANRVRLRYGYSGGADGSMHLTKGELGLAGNEYMDYETGGAGNRNPSGTSSNAGTSSDLKGLLDAWQQAAMQQSNGQIDYAVAKAVADLERALADAQPQFKEQAESVDRDARQAMDNSALYAEMRGDKGGIGQEQYNSIQNTQAQNHLAVQQAQTKLATDTQRQIADLRAQGEFEKADAALQITQNYLAQLISLEQWAAEYNLSVEQFNESVRQWEASYNMEMQKLQISQNQWQAEFDASQNRWQTEMEFAKQQYADSLSQWEREFAAEQALAQLKLNNTGGGGNTMSLDKAKSLAADGVFTPESLAAFYASGYTDDDLKRLYRYTPPVEPQTGQYDSESVARLGLGSNVSDEYIDQLINEGKLQFTVADGKIYVYWAEGYGYGGIPTLPMPPFFLTGNMPTAPLPSSPQLGNIPTGEYRFVSGSTAGRYSGSGASGDPTLNGVKN